MGTQQALAIGQPQRDHGVQVDEINHLLVEGAQLFAGSTLICELAPNDSVGQPAWHSVQAGDELRKPSKTGLLASSNIAELDLPLDAFGCDRSTSQSRVSVANLARGAVS